MKPYLEPFWREWKILEIGYLTLGDWTKWSTFMAAWIWRSGGDNLLGTYITRVVLHKVIQINIFLQDICTDLCSQWTQDHGCDFLMYKFVCSCWVIQNQHIWDNQWSQVWSKNLIQFSHLWLSRSHQPNNQTYSNRYPSSSHRPYKTTYKCVGWN